MATIVLIPAAGSGSRMRADVNKQYLQLADCPILVHTLRRFATHPGIDRIYLLAPEAELAYCRSEIVERYALPRIAGVVAGGAERQDSVYNGLRACAANDDDIIIVHDGVRPFVTAEMIATAVAAARQDGASAVGVPVKDTIKRVVDGLAVATPDRSELWQIQTPQCFRYDLLRRAHEAARRDALRATDDAMLVEHLGQPVRIVPGSYRNLKITTPEDLLIAGAFLAAGQGENP